MQRGNCLIAEKPNTLIMAIGNPGRSDDGLGPAFIAELEAQGFDQAELDSCYQLQIEDADRFSHYQRVIVVDAHKNPHQPIALQRLLPGKLMAFSSHALSAEGVLALCEGLYDTVPDAYTLAIGGEYWELGLTMSELAQQNLAAAVSLFLHQWPMLAEGVVA